MKGKIAFFVMLFLAFGLYTTTYAMFKTSKSGVGSLSAAKWSVKFSTGSTEITENTVIPLSNITWNNELGNVADGKIAPGSYTTFNILIDASGTETSVDYKVKTTFTSSNFEVTIGDGTIRDSGTIAYSDNDEDMKLLVPIRVEWLGNTNDDSNKNILDLSFKNTSLDIPIEVVVAQKLDNNRRLYAARPRSITYASVSNGASINTKIKKLAGNSKTYKTDIDSNVKAIVRSNTLSEANRTDYNRISTDTSEYEAYIWYENGTIYYYTEADRIRLNSDSGYLFSGLSNLTSLDLTNFDTSNVTNMAGMLQNCYKLKSIDLSYFNTSKVTDMSYLFWSCKALERLDLSNFDTSKVTNMYGMFYDAESLVYLNVSSFDTSKVTNMASMFGNLYKLEYLDITNFNTSKVTTLANMFNGCRSLKRINVSNFDTKNVTNMSRVFASCYSLYELDISSFDTRNVTTMEAMLNDLHTIRTIFVSDKFVLTKVKNGERMFKNDYYLVGGNGTTYNENRINLNYAYVDTDERIGYFTLK